MAGRQVARWLSVVVCGVAFLLAGCASTPSTSAAGHAPDHCQDPAPLQANHTVVRITGVDWSKRTMPKGNLSEFLETGRVNAHTRFSTDPGPYFRMDGNGCALFSIPYGPEVELYVCFMHGHGACPVQGGECYFDGGAGSFTPNVRYIERRVELHYACADGAVPADDADRAPRLEWTANAIASQSHANQDCLAAGDGNAPHYTMVQGSPMPSPAGKADPGFSSNAHPCPTYFIYRSTGNFTIGGKAHLVVYYACDVTVPEGERRFEAHVWKNNDEIARPSASSTLALPVPDNCLYGGNRVGADLDLATNVTFAPGDELVVEVELSFDTPMAGHNLHFLAGGDLPSHIAIPGLPWNGTPLPVYDPPEANRQGAATTDAVGAPAESGLGTTGTACLTAATRCGIEGKATSGGWPKGSRLAGWFGQVEAQAKANGWTIMAKSRVGW
jgi:hypothetical protein